MLKIKPFAIGLLAFVSIVPAANAFTLDNLPESNVAAENLYAQVKLDIRIGIGQEAYPQPQTRERVIIVERHPQTIDDRGRSRWSESRGRKEGWHKHGKYSQHGHNCDRDRDRD
jgi:hypothetical protein